MSVTYKEAIAGVEDVGPTHQLAYRDAWGLHEAIIMQSSVVHLWNVTDQGAYSATQDDQAATDWELRPYDGGIPPR